MLPSVQLVLFACLKFYDCQVIDGVAMVGMAVGYVTSCASEFQEVDAGAATDLGDRKAERLFLPAAFVTAERDGARPVTSVRCEW